jgi:hypothetical protein
MLFFLGLGTLSKDLGRQAPQSTVETKVILKNK